MDFRVLKTVSLNGSMFMHVHFSWRKDPQHLAQSQDDLWPSLKLRIEVLVRGRAGLILGHWILNYSELLKGLHKSNSKNCRKTMTLTVLNTCFWLWKSEQAFCNTRGMSSSRLYKNELKYRNSLANGKITTVAFTGMDERWTQSTEMFSITISFMEALTEIYLPGLFSKSCPVLPRGYKPSSPLCFLRAIFLPNWLQSPLGTHIISPTRKRLWDLAWLLSQPHSSPSAPRTW